MHIHPPGSTLHLWNDLYCVKWGVKLYLLTLAQHQIVNSINVGGRLCCSWPAATRLSCYRSSLFQMLNKVIQRTFLSSFSRKFIGQSNCIITVSKLQFFLNKNYLLYTLTHHFVIWSHRSCRLLRCHGNGCSWYSAILIIFTAKYQAWMDNYSCQISLILFDFGGSYET